MIHGAQVEVTCDRERCTESVFVGLEWRYDDLTGKNGFWDPSDTKTEKRLARDHDWVVRDGKHFCCPEHAEPTEAPT